jgi:hypothetical protein
VLDTGRWYVWSFWSGLTHVADESGGARGAGEEVEPFFGLELRER